MSCLRFSDLRRITTILAVALALALAAGSASAASILGEWAVKMDYQGNLIPAKLIFEKKDGAVVGKWISERGESDLSKISCEGDVLKFTRKIKFQDQEFDLDYEGKVEGTKLTGKFVTPMGEMEANGELAKPAEGAPAPAPAEAAKPAEGGNAAVGEWDLVVNSQLGENKRKLTITPDLKGVYASDFGKFDTKDMKLDGDKLTFDVTLTMDGNALDLKFDGKIAGDKLEGKFTSDMGDATVKGSKGGAAAAAAAPSDEALTGEVKLAGLWKMTIETPDGATTEGDLTVTEEGGKFKGLLSTQLGEVKIEEVKIDGNKLSFATTVDFGGVLVPIKFDGSTGGDKLKGLVNLNMDGQEMELPVQGTKSNEKPGLTGAVDLPGTWKLEVETPDGAISQSDMTISKDGDKFIADLVTELGSGKIPNITVDGNKVSFKTEIDFGGQMVPLAFSGTTGGDKIEGVIKVTFEGQEMELPLKGTKAEAKTADACCSKPSCGPGCKGSAACGACCKGGAEEKPKTSADACCTKPGCGDGCKGSAGCGACCKA